MADPVTRASKPPREGKPGGGKGGAHKELMGLPIWMWAAGAVVLIGGYLYLKSHSSQSQQGQGQGGGKGQVFAVGSQTGLSYEQLLLILKDWQNHGHGKGGHHHHHNPGGDIGPERQWLINKTGSKHPWTYLAQHHERIVVGPHGTRVIRKQGK